MDDPKDKDEIVTALEQTAQEIKGYFSGLTPQQFYSGTQQHWAPAHHLQHLTPSVRPVALGLKTPKLLLSLLSLGKPVPKHTYAKIRDTYRRALAGGNARATGVFAPRLEGGVYEADRSKVLEGFFKAHTSLVGALDPWGDQSLDEYAMPHPALGQLSVREMLFFSLYHNRHHPQGARMRLG